MFQPIYEAFGRFLGTYYSQLVPTTKPMREYVTRGAEKSLAYAPGRMVDAAEDMLASWQRNDSDSTTTAPYKMPVIVFAIAKEYIPTGRDFTHQIFDPTPVRVTEGGKVYGIREIAADIRAQVVFFAMDQQTAQSLAAQFALYLDGNRRFTSTYMLDGQATYWPVVVESPDMPVSNIPNGTKNTTILAVDLTLKAAAPLLGDEMLVVEEVDFFKDRLDPDPADFIIPKP